MVERERVTVFDTTLRDGEQSPGCSMNGEEKLRMAHQLDALGVDVIEAGFPIASDGEFRAVEAVAQQVRRPAIAALARARHEDIQCAWRAIQRAAHPRIHTFLATSEIHLHHKLHLTRRQCLEQAREAVGLAASLCADVEFSPEDATRTETEFLCEVLEAVIEAGATTLNIPDTVGYAVPAEFAKLIETLRQQVRGIERVTISVHCHNDLGLAVANSLAAVAAGAQQVECTINGIGERAGNACPGRNCDGDARPPRPLSFRYRRSRATRFLPPAKCWRKLPVLPCSRTRPSSAATPSRTKPASTRTGW